MQTFTRMSDGAECTSYSLTETAALIRKALKVSFPGTKFSITSKRYTGGGSVYVNWTGGPASTDVEGIAHRFSGTDSEGIAHSLVADGTDTPKYVRYGATAILCQRS